MLHHRDFSLCEEGSSDGVLCWSPFLSSLKHKSFKFALHIKQKTAALFTQTINCLGFIEHGPNETLSIRLSPDPVKKPFLRKGNREKRLSYAK